MNGVSIERVSPVQITYATFCSTSHTPNSSSSEMIGSAASTRRTSVRSNAQPIAKNAGTITSGASSGWMPNAVKSHHVTYAPSIRKPAFARLMILSTP